MNTLILLVTFRDVVSSKLNTEWFAIRSADVAATMIRDFQEQSKTQMYKLQDWVCFEAKRIELPGLMTVAVGPPSPTKSPAFSTTPPATQPKQGDK